MRQRLFIKDGTALDISHPIERILADLSRPVVFRAPSRWRRSGRDELVERWRVLLGLLPWEEHAANARRALAKAASVTGVAYELGRRSGRTTRGLLYALARCVEVGTDTLHVHAETLAVADDAVSAARDMIDKLGLVGINVQRASRSPHRHRGRGASYVEYEDHFRGLR